MEKLFYKMPSTIGEELKAQIEYCKYIGKITNTSDLSLKMRELEKEVFGEKRKYVNGQGSVRPATITKLCKITSIEEITDYFLLYSSFKALNVIKEDHNIVELLDFYGITPKKEIDKEKLKELKEKNKIIKKERCVKFCFGCHDKMIQICNNANKCLYIKIKNNLKNMLLVDEKIKYLYKLGFPSCFEKMAKSNNQHDYRLPISSIKIILSELGEFEKLDFINKLEKRYLEKSNNRRQKQEERKIENENQIKKLKEEIKQMEINGCNGLQDAHKLQHNKEKYLICENIKENTKKICKDKDYEEMLFIIYKKCIFNQMINDKDETFESFLKK